MRAALRGVVASARETRPLELVRRRASLMRLVGVDLHTRDQSIAMVDTETGETRELRLRHEGEEVEQFYRSLAPPVTVGIGSTGYALWFHHVMHRLGHTLAVYEAAKMRAPLVRPRKQDRPEARDVGALSRA